MFYRIRLTRYRMLWYVLRLLTLLKNRSVELQATVLDDYSSSCLIDWVRLTVKFSKIKIILCFKKSLTCSIKLWFEVQLLRAFEITNFVNYEPRNNSNKLAKINESKNEFIEKFFEIETATKIQRFHEIPFPNSRSKFWIVIKNVRISWSCQKFEFSRDFPTFYFMKVVHKLPRYWPSDHFGFQDRPIWQILWQTTVHFKL